MVTRALRRTLRVDRRGATAVEHAMVLPVFFLLVLMVVEVAWQGVVAAAVDHGARRGARWVSLGVAAPGGASRPDHVKQVIVSTAGLPLDPARITVTSRAYANYAQLATAGAGTPGLGGPDQVVRYVVEYQSRALTPGATGLVPSGWLRFRFVVVVQNEPYPVS